MRVAIVNDSNVATMGLEKILSTTGEHQVAWTAKDGEEAVKNCAKDTPELVLMDLIMPVMNGLEATRQIMKISPCPILIVTASVDENVAMVFEAMGVGALDAVSTPVLGGNGQVSGDNELLRKIATIKKLTEAAIKRERRQIDSIDSRSPMSDSPLLAIGASTGGPLAVSKILTRLPENYPAAGVIVQHVDQQFSVEMASWLDNQCALTVRVAENGDRMTPGTIVLAGTNNHLKLDADGTLKYSPEPRHIVYRPSVDVFFETIATYWRGKMLGILLTGMGRDGAKGLLELRKRGVHTIAQDETSCAVYGMPKAAVEIDAAVEVMSIDRIATSAVEYFMKKNYI